MSIYIYIFILKEIVRNGNFESMTRREAASIEYPPPLFR